MFHVCILCEPLGDSQNKHQNYIYDTFKYQPQMCKTRRCFFLKLMQSERISSFMYILLVKAHIAFLLKFIITFTTFSNLQPQYLQYFRQLTEHPLKVGRLFQICTCKISLHVSIVCGLSCASRKWHQNYIHHNSLNYSIQKNGRQKHLQYLAQNPKFYQKI